ncbi:hypothetical protein [Streptomyces sp. NPDC086519]|uniref:hypothetical protein n=1 Tax=Streptomyces sp. NPDC086519 TaxID=3154863 RepID=UPI00343E142B
MGDRTAAVSPRSRYEVIPVSLFPGTRCVAGTIRPDGAAVAAQLLLDTVGRDSTRRSATCPGT